MAADFKDTLNLPTTDFPMRGDLAKREPAHFQQWDQQQLYQQILTARADAPVFLLHDGPPYANGNIHIGHALNKILKDIVIRYKTMRGHRAPYIPGWDCHGLPIEQQILKQIGDRIHDMEPLELRRMCHSYASEWIDRQRTQFKRLGIMGDWQQPYATVDPSYEVGILKVLLALVEKGLIRKGHKVVQWDTVFRTALAEAEIEYHQHTSPAIYVAMPLLDPQSIPALAGLDNAAIVIWTTTPWTMPANMGISLHPEFTYVAVRAPDGRNLIVAEGLLEAFRRACNLQDAAVVASFRASDFDRKWARHPIFDDRQSLIMLGDHVTLEQGTGCVHTAPGHGADDFVIGQRYGLDVLCPVDEKGCYTDAFPQLQGTFVFDANPMVIELLQQRGLLLAQGKVQHEYPHSWRSGKPIIFRATEQWFMVLAEGNVRENALKAIHEDVTWIPAWGRERIAAMVERRPEWCISRQRNWGVPIPAVRDLRTGESLLIPGLIQKFIEAVAANGTNVWYSEPLAAFLPEGYNPEDYEKEHAILDVWFDSGASHVAAMEMDPRMEPPADLYLEGSDQHRGWFQHALLTSIGARGRAPFRSVLTHGFVLDDKGEAMSKSKGNVISPLDLTDKFGADILRLWVASTDYRNDVAISNEIMKITADTYRTIRNTLRFQLGNLHDFDPTTDLIDPDSLCPLDQWALNELASLVDAVTEAYERYEFHRGYQAINRFYTVTLSARYHDFLKDRLYTFKADGHHRRSAQTVIHHHLDVLSRLLAPVLVFTCDEATTARRDQPAPSVHLLDWPTVPDDWRMPDVAAEMDALLDLRDPVNELLEQLRSRKEIGKSIEAALTIEAPEGQPITTILQKHLPSLAELFIVSTVSLTVSSAIQQPGFSVKIASGVRCPRCWRTVDALLPSASGEICPRCSEAVHTS
jgi:isoleucyl-tRNA synthetase